MINNLLEKAKSVIEDVNRNLQSPSKGGSFEYDESYFQLQLEGGPIHTDLLTVRAKSKQDEHEGEEIPLNCKWFYTEIQDELKEIQGVSGSSYQPCIDDVGNRILVQSDPRLNGTYIGMPIFKEVGPLKLDPELEKKACKELEKMTCEIRVRIEAIYFDYDFKNVHLPCDGVLTLSKEDGLAISSLNNEGKLHRLSSCRYTKKYPLVQIQRSSNQIFELHLDSIDSVKLSVADHLERDLAAIIIRMFNKTKPAKPVEEKVNDKPQHQQETIEEGEGEIETKSETKNFEETMRIDQLSNLLKETEKEKLYFKSSFEVEQKKRQKLETENQEIKAQLETLIKENDEKAEELKELYQVKEKLSAEKLFFLQEKNLYKSQISELEHIIQNYENNAKQESNLEEPAEEKIDEEKRHQENIINLNKKMLTIEEKNEQLEKENEELKKKLEQGIVEKEDLESTINSLQKKTQSLIQECGKLNVEKGNTPPSSTIWTFPLSPLVNKPQDRSPLRIFGDPKVDEFTKLQEKVQTYEDELKQLRETNAKLNITVETMKIAQESGNKGIMKKGLFGKVVGSVGSVVGTVVGAGQKNHGQEVEYLQKLVNTLTETITEKDFILENTKKVNKELGKKITELEVQVLEQSK